MWVLRVTIVVFLIIPGSIPALIVTILTYIVSLFDPNMILKGLILEYYNEYVQIIPPWIRFIISISLITLVLYIYIKIELRRIGNSAIFEALKIRLTKIYEKYLRFPRIEFEELSYD